MDEFQQYFTGDSDNPEVTVDIGCADSLQEKLLRTFNLCTPILSNNNNQNRAKSEKWYSPELKIMKRKCKRLEHKWRMSKTGSDRQIYKDEMKIYNIAIRNAKKKLFCKPCN